MPTTFEASATDYAPRLSALGCALTNPQKLLNLPVDNI
jgi:hypothetical protein